MLRAAALSLLILASVVVMLPAGDSSAHHTNRAHASRRSNMGRRHSRAWWRRHRARLRRRRAALRRRQVVQHMRRGRNLNAAAENHNKSALAEKISTHNLPQKPAGPTAPALPDGWTRRASAGGGMRFLLNSGGRSVAEATFAPVNVQATGEPALTAKAQRRMLGGVPFSELRRTVIDKMVASDGWVVNDMSREVAGRPVFVVIARTNEQSWVFYFTEVEGRIYSLAASSPADFAGRLADESAQLMASFHANRQAPPAAPGR